MNLECDVKVEYTESARFNSKFRKDVTVSFVVDEWGHNILFIGPKSRKAEFQLESNIKRIFANFIHQGKLTISLRQPSVNIFVAEANPTQLKNFVTLLELVRKNPDADLVEEAERNGFLVQPEMEEEDLSSSESM